MSVFEIFSDPFLDLFRSLPMTFFDIPIFKAKLTECAELFVDGTLKARGYFLRLRLWNYLNAVGSGESLNSLF